MFKSLTVSLLLSSSTFAAEWETLPPMPAPNGGFIYGSRAGQIVVIGGTNWVGGTKNWLRAEHEFDPRNKKWSTVRELDRPVAYGIPLQNGPEFSFLGGSDGEKPLRRIPGLPAEVVLSSGGLIDGEIVIVGGTDDAANVAGLTVATYVVKGQTVIRKADYPGRPVATAASAVLGSELFVFGGVNYDSATKLPVNTADAFAFSPSRNSWRTLKSLSSPSRGTNAVALDQNRIYLAGGYRDAFTAKSFVYDVAKDEYRPSKPLPYAGMVGLVKLDDYVYCFGGEDNMKSRTDKCFRIPVAKLRPVN